MKPYKITLFIFGCIALLALLCAVFPTEGIQCGSVTVRFPTIGEVLHKNVDAEEPTETPEELLDRRMNEMRVSADAQYRNFFATNQARIQFPNDSIEMFDALFDALDSAREKPLRIMHYGDSQIEEDRITNTVREKLQQRFGGGGVGLLPVIQTIPSRTVSQSCSAELPRYLVFGPPEFRAAHHRYGPMGQMCKIDTSVLCTFTARSGKSSHAAHFSQLTVLVGRVRSSFSASVLDQTQQLDSTEASLHRLHFQLPDSTRRVSLKMAGNADVYGIMLDGKNGISMDNIPMRGCSGTIFTNIDRHLLADFYKEQNVRLIILEYGGNSVPYLKNDAAIMQYKTAIIKQINYLKSIAPKAMFLFIGPSDMTTRVQGEMQTYPNLPQVVSALRDAALETNIAYWNLYEVMGGHNSMKSWVNANPPLAGADYVHFTPKGADRVGEMLYKSLMLYYDYYKWRQKSAAEMADNQLEEDSIRE